MNTARWFGAVVGMLLGMWVMAFAQSWTAPKTWSQGELVTPDHLNTHIRDNLTVLRAGGLAISGQAANRIPYASSATQLATSSSLTFDGTNLVVPAEAYRTGATSYLRLSGGDAADQGGTIAVFGQTHASAPNQITLKATGGVNTTGFINSASTQPGFEAYRSGDTSFSDGQTITFDSEVYDTASNFASSTFTAPVDGKYLFCATVQLTSATSGQSFGINLVTTDFTRRLAVSPAMAGVTYTATIGNCAIAQMDATDTAHIALAASGTNATAGSGSSPMLSHFTGRLMP